MAPKDGSASLSSCPSTDPTPASSTDATVEWSTPGKPERNCAARGSSLRDRCAAALRGSPAINRPARARRRFSRLHGPLGPQPGRGSRVTSASRASRRDRGPRRSASASSHAASLGPVSVARPGFRFRGPADTPPAEGRAWRAAATVCGGPGGCGED